MQLNLTKLSLSLIISLTMTGFVACSKQDASSTTTNKTTNTQDVASTTQTNKQVNSQDNTSDDIQALQKSYIKQVYNQQMKANIVHAEQAALQLNSQLKEFCSNPSKQGLTEAQNAWKNTMHAWSRAWVVKIPSLNQPHLRDRMYIYAYPDSRQLTKRNLDRMLSEDMTFDKAWAENANIRPLGLMGLEYMLFSKITSVNDVKNTPKYCDLIQAQATQLHTDIQDRATMWSGDYGQTFANATQDFAQKDAGVTAWYNNLLQLAKFIQEQKLAKPVGLNDKGMAKDHFETPYANISLDLYKTSFDVLKTGVLGKSVTKGSAEKPILGLVDYMVDSQKNDAVTKQIIDQLHSEFATEDKILTSMQGTQLQTQKLADLEALNDAMKAIVITLKSDVSKQMNVPITFNDADGD